MENITNPTTESTANQCDITYREESDLDAHIASLCHQLNRSLDPPINFQPPEKPLVLRHRYRADVLRKLATALSKEAEPSNDSEDHQADSDALNWMITRLEERFKTVGYREKRRLFTLIPPQMSYQTIRARFGCSNDFILESRKFQAESEVIDEPPAKIGRRLPELLRELVVAFY
jgi:hypothetical protein